MRGAKFVSLLFSPRTPQVTRSARASATVTVFTVPALHLYGANVAAFTTTQYKGRLPTITQYPRDAADREECHRYTKRFKPDRYFKFKMAECDNQVHFLLLKNNIWRERFVADVLRGCLPDTEDADWDKYFPRGRPNEYTSFKVFVNVFFYHAVPVRYAGTVRKGASVNVTRNPVPKNYLWLMQLVETTMADAALAQDDECSDSDSDNLLELMGRVRIDG